MKSLERLFPDLSISLLSEVKTHFGRWKGNWTGETALSLLSDLLYSYGGQLDAVLVWTPLGMVSLVQEILPFLPLIQHSGMPLSCE